MAPRRLHVDRRAWPARISGTAAVDVHRQDVARHADRDGPAACAASVLSMPRMSGATAERARRRCASRPARASPSSAGSTVGRPSTRSRRTPALWAIQSKKPSKVWPRGVGIGEDRWRVRGGRRRRCRRAPRVQDRVPGLERRPAVGRDEQHRSTARQPRHLHVAGVHPDVGVVEDADGMGLVERPAAEHVVEDHRDAQRADRHGARRRVGQREAEHQRAAIHAPRAGDLQGSRRRASARGRRPPGRRRPAAASSPGARAAAVE